MNKQTTFRIITIVLAVIIVIGLFTYYFIFRNEDSSPPVKAYINFGYDLNEGENVTIKKVNASRVDDDIDIYAYDFKLSSGQPDGAIEIIIPYKDNGLNEDEELLSVCGKYLNEQTNEWEDVFYTVDTEANNVHIVTDHLSTYSAFKINNPGKRSEYISDINVYAAYMTNTRAQAVLEAYATQADSWRLDAVGAFLESTGTIEYFGATNIHTLITLGEAYDDLVTKPFQNAMTGLGISTACTQLAYDTYNNGIHSSETATSAMKSSLSIAINFATPSIKMAYVGVGLIDLALTDVQTYAVEQKYESTKNMYDAYYKRSNIKRDHKYWRKLFEDIYKANKDDPQTALDKMNDEIDRYVNEYWSVAEYDWESWIDSYDKNAKLSKYPWPSKKDRMNISAIHKVNLYDDLYSVFRKMSLNMYLDSLIEREKEYKKLATHYNKKFSIVIREDIESSENSTWAGCYARLAPLSGKANPSSWTGKLSSDGGGIITFTMLAHIKAGFPMTLELYQTAADIKSGNKLKTIRLKPFSGNEQTIVLKPRELIKPTPTEPPITAPPIQEDNPWYDVTIQSSDTNRPNAFAGWYAVLAYPEDSAPDLKNMYKSFDNKGKCMLSFQKSDYEALESPSKIWLYQNVADLLSKKKPNVIANFSISSGSYAGEYQGESLYTIIVKAKPPENKPDILESISGDYASYIIRSELFIPGEGMMQIDKKENFDPWENPSADVWLHYNGTSLTYKSYADPYNTENVLEKLSDSRYELVIQEDTSTLKYTVEIITTGYSAKLTFLSENESGYRLMQIYMLERK